jgi:uncharacterized cupredoxin-like copper-binding protein
MRRQAVLSFVTGVTAALAFSLQAVAHEGHGHEEPEPAPAETHQHGGGHEHGDDVAYGRPGKAQDVTRTITLTATEMRYSESELTASVGETIRFVLVNKGRQDHELMIADANEQLRHRMMMLSQDDAKKPMHHHGTNVIEAKPGETKELIWTFTKPGTFEFSCNFPGHAEGGMTGKLVVKATSNDQSAAHDHGAQQGQAQQGHAQHDATPQAHGATQDHGAMTMTGDLGPYPMSREASGTSWQPDASAHMGGHVMLGEWSVMAHLLLNAVYDWQDGPRGDEKAFAAGMVMVMAQRDLGDGNTLALRAMLSPDPFMGKSGYPLLLAAGETADGTTPLIDRQHPHELFMELAASISHRFDDETSVFFYAGLPGEPAFGPPAFMHRMSSMDSPEAPITHHWFDSTHITFGVLTAGFVKDDWKIEVSGFRGREPDEDRFDIESPRLDSVSARLSYNPSENWALQVSWADIHSPELLEPDVDESRVSASAIYTVAFENESWWSTTAGWAIKDPSDGGTLNAFMLESAYAPDGDWTLFARGEINENHELSGTGRIDTVGKISLGVIRDFSIAENVKLGIGGLYSFNFIPDALEPSYDGDPDGAMIFLRLKASS